MKNKKKKNSSTKIYFNKIILKNEFFNLHTLFFILFMRKKVIKSRKEPQKKIKVKNYHLLFYVILSFLIKERESKKKRNIKKNVKLDDIYILK
jgi:superfamily I DNA and/or RNA helicase